MADNLERTATVVPFGPANGTEREFTVGAWVAFAHAPTFYARVVVKITRDYFGRISVKITPNPEDPAKIRARVRELLDGASIRFFPSLPQKPSDITLNQAHAEVIARWYWAFTGVDKVSFEFMMLDVAEILSRG